MKPTTPEPLEHYPAANPLVFSVLDAGVLSGVVAGSGVLAYTWSAAWGLGALTLGALLVSAVFYLRHQQRSNDGVALRLYPDAIVIEPSQGSARRFTFAELRLARWDEAQGGLVLMTRPGARYTFSPMTTKGVGPDLAQRLTEMLLQHASVPPASGVRTAASPSLTTPRAAAG